MSCDWDVRCLDCEEDHGFSDLNHESDLMMRLATMGPALAAFAPTMALLEKAGDVTMKVSYDRGRVDFGWFAKHGNRRMRRLVLVLRVQAHEALPCTPRR